MTGPAVKSRVRRSRRWLRLVIPLAAVGLVWLFTAVAHAYQEPDLRDAGTLSPAGTGRHGSSQLARRLTERGVSVVRVTSSSAALAAAGGNATIFVPTPDLLDYRFMSRLDLAPGRHRIVLVRPRVTGSPATGQSVWVAHRRWAAGQADPGCQARYATGRATVRRDSYGWSPERMPVAPTACYGGSVFSVDDGQDELILVGATEPFRNDRLAEGGNAALATGLLAEHGRLVWVDVHRREAQTVPLDLPGLPQYRRGDRDRAHGDSFFGSFPPQLWAVLLLLIVAAALLGGAQARRLGPPVAEPLPVLVPAAETVTGRGRLYHRIRARRTSLDTLRAAAVARLARALDPLGGAPERQLDTDGPARTEFVDKVAGWAGVPPQTVRTVLFGPAPDTDGELIAAAAELDRLVAAALTSRLRPDPPGQHPGAQPNQPPGGAL